VSWQFSVFGDSVKREAGAGRAGGRRRPERRTLPVLPADVLPGRLPAMLKLRVLCFALAAAGLAGCGGGQMAYPETTTVLEVVSIPPRCVVEMNGEYLGGTPVKIDISPSTRHRITVSTPNNRAVETKEWRGGEVVPRRVLFRPPYAYLTGTGR